MPPSPIPRQVVLALLATAILLPITVCVVVGVAALLMEMGDVSGGGALYHVALGCGILWAINLISLVLVLAVGTVRGPDEEDADRGQGSGIRGQGSEI